MYITMLRGSRCTLWSRYDDLHRVDFSLRCFSDRREDKEEMKFAFASRRSEVLSTRGLISTSNPLASQIGIKILEEGGNAADACVAVAAALNVVEPCSTGIGGDAFALYFDAETKVVSAINGSGRSPARLNKAYLLDKGLVSGDGWKDVHHASTAMVPGACAAWFDLVERHGSLSMKEILKPAIELAERGFPVAEITARVWKQHEALLQRTQARELLTAEGQAPEFASVFRNPGLAKTFRAISKSGRDAFYGEGEIATAMSEAVQSAGGVLEASDIHLHKSTFEDPISTVYRNRFRVYECAPNGQGLAALIALNICERFQNFDSMSAGEQMHIQIEAMRLAFADAAAFIGDSDFENTLNTEALLSKQYASERAALIDLNQATLFEHGNPRHSCDTVYFACVDENGNGCSFINSNYKGFGTGIVPSGWGFSIQNRGCNFYVGHDESHPNFVGPKKRSYHTIIPALVTHADSGNLFSVMGVMGEYMQPQGHLQTMMNLFHNDQIGPQESLDRCRFCIDFQGAGVKLEEGMSGQVVEYLKARGHAVEIVTSWDRKVFGRGQILLAGKDGGVRRAGCDPRSDGLALGQI